MPSATHEALKAAAAQRRLGAILERCKLPRERHRTTTAAHTHTALGGPKAPGGSFAVHGDDEAELLAAAGDCLKAGLDMSLTERPLDAGQPPIVDLDLRWPTAERRYDMELLEAFMRGFSGNLARYVRVPPQGFDWWVLEKPAPRLAPRKRADEPVAYKDGVHLVCTNVVTPSIVQRQARLDWLADESNAGFFDCLTITAAEDAFDAAVLSGKQQWFLYGSSKPQCDPHPWRATARMTVDFGSEPCCCPSAAQVCFERRLDADLPAGSLDLSAEAKLVEQLSIRRLAAAAPADHLAPPYPQLTQEGRAVEEAAHGPRTPSICSLLGPAIPTSARSPKQAAAAHNAYGAGGSNKNRPAAGTGGHEEGGHAKWDDCKAAAASIQAQEACQLVARLSPERAHAYNTWTAVGLCLHNIAANLAEAGASEALRQAWHNFSRLSDKYNRDECDQRWDRMPVRPAAASGAKRLGMGSLVMWARQDAPIVPTPVAISVATSGLDSPELSVSSFTNPSSHGTRRDKEKEPSAWEHVLHKIESYSAERGLRKVVSQRMIFEPVPGCPCAYRPLMGFGDFVPHVLRGDQHYRSNMRRAAELETYLTKYNEPALPRLVTDRSLLSFSNGVLVLYGGETELQFVPYDEGELPENLKGRAARQHIHLPYTGGVETPLLGKLLHKQFDGPDDGRLEALCALIGRLLFPMKALDSWQVMPLIVGGAGTGKSTLLNIVTAMFSPAAVAELDGSNERTFGMQDKHDKEVLFIRDAPHRMSAVLAQEEFQKMVAGEGVQVSVKHGTAFKVEWSVPMIAASNHMFDYDDRAGQISRRVVPFRFDVPVDPNDIDDTLERRLLHEELPNIIARCVMAYLRLVRCAAGRGFWKVCPEALREAQEDAIAAADPLCQFLLAGRDDNAGRYVRIYVRYREDAVTEWSAFKRAFEQYVEHRHKGVWVPSIATSNAAPFRKLGYDLRARHICKACNAIAKLGCCSSYNKANRVKQWRIHNMELVREERTGTMMEDAEEQQAANNGMSF